MWCVIRWSSSRAAGQPTECQSLEAREVYKENVNDVHSYCDQLAAEYGIPIALQFANNGFEFVCRKEELQDNVLPSKFVNVVRVVMRWSRPDGFLRQIH
jgi:hypothetical protein